MTVAGGASLEWQPRVVETLRRLCDVGRDAASWRRLGGNTSVSHWSLSIPPSRFFVKAAVGDSMGLDAEREGLQAIAATGAVKVPAVIAFWQDEPVTVLVLDWLEIVATGGAAALGAALARMHASTSTRFGWHRDNTIGAAPQQNAWADDWTAFFRDRRLRVQFEIAGRQGHSELARAGEALLERVPALLAGHRPKASLLHGDLWSGNAARLGDGVSAVFDPAVYYGDGETDLAMTSLFGGFDASFYQAYASLAPLADGHAARRTLYNLYHVLNHANLFGGAYAGQAKRMIAELLRGR